MDGVIFATGLDNAFFYNAPTAWARNNLDQDIDSLFVERKIKEVHCAAFGPTKDCFIFIVSKNQGAGLASFHGSGCPEALTRWLTDDGARNALKEDVHVALGPGGSFMAWNRDSIRWAGLPLGLEGVIQSWLSPSGWKDGPPRIVALGCSGAYFALSEYGSVAYHIPSSLASLRRLVDDIESLAGFSWSTIRAFSISCADPDHYAVIFADSCVVGNGPDRSEFRRVAESFATDEIKRRYRAEWDEAETHAVVLRNELEAHFAAWKGACDAAFQPDAVITHFPYLPLEVCTCTDAACLVRKRDPGLEACRHDVERLLRASRQYSVAWLRNERLAWHPDRFWRRCAADRREEFTRKATEMYAIFEELITSEFGA